MALSSENLIKATIFTLLSSFFEYGLKEVYNLVFPDLPLPPPKPSLKKDIFKHLRSEGIIGDPPKSYKEHVLENRDAVRNAFAHGSWEELDKATQELDLPEAFLSVVSYFQEVENNLRSHAKKFEP